jgi:uncharacterized protein YjiS (DUF1127 family)
MRLTHIWTDAGPLDRVRDPTYMQCNKLNGVPRTNRPGTPEATAEDAMLTISNLKTNLRRWARVRNTIRELSQLTDRDLSDLGISRSDIRSVARRSIAR